MTVIPTKQLETFPVDPVLFRRKPGNAGIDLFTAVDIRLGPGEQLAVPTGLCFAIPEGTEIQVRPRSGLAKNFRISVTNAPGTVDPSYRGEVLVLLENTAPVLLPSHVTTLLEFIRDDASDGFDQLLDEFLTSLAARTLVLSRGDRFAQIVVAEFVDATFEFVDELSDTDRGSQGFGSSGVSSQLSL